MPIRKHTYYVYILSNSNGVLYVGVTNNILRRMQEHKQGTIPGFTKRYKISRLLYVEETGDIQLAIAREKEIKNWRRTKKLALVREQNPEFRDLCEDWFDDDAGS